VGGNVARYSITGSAKKKANIHNSEELIQKVWESVRSNNGIMVYLHNSSICNVLIIICVVLLI
jgi:HIV-1 Vpr-binding protein